MNTFREVFTEAKKRLAIKNLPKEIDAGEYENAEFYGYTNKTGSYEYAQIEYTPDGSGDYDYGAYNQGYTLEMDVELKDKQLHLTTKVLDLGQSAHGKFGKKYSGLAFDDIDSFIAQAKKIIKEFDKI